MFDRQRLFILGILWFHVRSLMWRTVCFTGKNIDLSGKDSRVYLQFTKHDSSVAGPFVISWESFKMSVCILRVNSPIYFPLLSDLFYVKPRIKFKATTLSTLYIPPTISKCLTIIIL